MTKRISIWLNQMVWAKLAGVAQFCKILNKGMLRLVTLFIASCTVVSLLGKDNLANFVFLKNAYYDTVVATWPQFVDFLSAPVGKVLFVVIALILCFCHLLRRFYRPFALCIAHSTMGYDVNILEPKFKKSYWFKTEAVGTQLPATATSWDDIVAAIQAQDNAQRDIVDTNWRPTVFYGGIAHTPLIFRLGYQFGTRSPIWLLHRFRNSPTDHGFKVLPEVAYDKLALLHRNTKRDPEIQSDELLVGISTSYPIIEENLLAIDPTKSMHWRLIQVDNKDNGVDFFDSYHKIRCYADSFEADIEDFVRAHNIKTVHIVLSSSVAFTFYLGQLMSNNQFHKIIVYHYDRTTFTWGIDITENDPEKAVVMLPDTKS